MKKENLLKFCFDALVVAGADKKEAKVMADILVWCDSVGRYTQGVWRLPIIIKRLRMGLYLTPCDFEIEMSGESLGRVDAKNGLAHFVAHEVTLNAIEIAKRQGICAMTIRNSNYFGASGYYAKMIADAGMIGVVLSNSFPKVMAFGGDAPVMGTNPFAFACPALDDKPLLIDMSTSEVSGSVVRKAREQLHTNSEYMKDECLSPFGGAKGFALSLLVEVLAGVLSGGGMSHDVKSMYNNFDEGGNNGHFILAIDISKFMPVEQFNLRMQYLIRFLRDSGSDENSVQYPGENRWKTLGVHECSGLKTDDETLQKLRQLSIDLGVELIES